MEKLINRIVKESFNKYNAPDLVSQLVAVLSKEPKREHGKMENIVKSLKNVSSDIYKELKKPKLQMASKS